MAYLVKANAVRLARGSANLKFDDDRIQDLKKSISDIIWKIVKNQDILRVVIFHLSLLFSSIHTAKPMLNRELHCNFHNTKFHYVYVLFQGDTIPRVGE